MQISWFTVIAQLVNFTLLIWLMKKYLYKPILQAVDEREKKIASELKEAKSTMEHAKKEQDDFTKKNDAFDLNKKKLMAKATAEAATERQLLLDTAKKEVNDVKEKLLTASTEFAENLGVQVVQNIHQKVFDITNKALSTLANTNIEEQLIDVFIHKIKTITEKDKKEFVHAFQSDSLPVVIKSAYKLSAKEHSSIKTAIAEVLGNHSKYEFKTDPKMIGGVELATNGYKLSWSFSAYLNSLEKSIVTKKVKAED